MIMHSVALPATNQEENLIIPISPSLSIEPFVALTARIKTSDKAVAAGLNCLRESMAPGDFTRYIESLVDIRIGKGTLWLLTDQAMHKTLLERNFMLQLRNAFTGLRIRIMSQG